MRIKVCSIMVLCVLGIGLAVECVVGRTLPSPRNVKLLIVPARPRMIQLALDMVQLRSVALVAYYGEAKTANPVLHVWEGADWRYVSLTDFADKRFVSSGVQQVIVIGNDQTVPAVLFSSMPWCSQIERLPTLNITDLINSLNRYFKFRKREWTWLSKRYGLTLVDLNAERRAYNPYNTPRSKLPLEKREFKQEEGDLAPAQLIEKTPASTTNAKTPSAEKPSK